VQFDGVFDRTGAQIGWWHGDYIQDRYGRVVLFRPHAIIQNLSMPQPKKIPRPPTPHLPSGHPTLRWLLMPPFRAHGWADFGALLDALGYRPSAAEKLRAFVGTGQAS
jgi:hypothetical protein